MTEKKHIKIYFIILLLVLTFKSNAQIPEGVKSYAVTGVFSLERNANRFAAYYSTQSLNSQVKKNFYNNLFYVYVYESTDVEEVRNRVFDVRGAYNALSKTWLYNGNFNCLHIPSDQLKGVTELMSRNTGGIEEPEVMEVEKPEEIIEEVPVKIQAPKVERKQGTFWVYFNTYNETDLNEVEGKVKIIDAERSKDLATEASHNLIILNAPRNGTNRVQFATDIFGYRTAKLTIDLDEPVTEDNKKLVSTIGDSIIIDFPLKRYNKGDFITMYNVYFYIDAAIMKEESVLELNQLLNMMHENEDIKIMLHGHTNGNSHGLVKHLDLDDKKFFSLNGSHQEEKATAKKLSLFRAHTIKYWLMDQGIAEDRMDIVGWGGKKMLYDKHGANAELNVRVEVEITEE